MTNIAEKIYKYYLDLKSTTKLPNGVEVMNPYKSPDTRKYIQLFLNKFYSDQKRRVLVLGINPGRFGGGTTGVSFTDPFALETFCKIDNHLPKVRELSSVFIYEFIQKWGSPRSFYSKFFLSAICPLGLTKNGKNYNYYDDGKTYKKILPFIKKTLLEQASIISKSKAVIILGNGKNLKYFTKINGELKLFDRVYSVEHPRFIMQYKRKSKEQFIEKYQQVFSDALKERV